MSVDASDRTGLRESDHHATWREVYRANNVDPDQHEVNVDADANN